MTERQQKLRLGIFVVVTLGMFSTLILLFGGAPGWFTQTNAYTIGFSDAPGISPGTPVRKSGVKVGEVGSVRLDDATGQVIVGVRLDPKFTPRTSDEPTVTRGLLAGDAAIDFIPRVTDKPVLGEPIPPGTYIVGISPFNAKLLLDQATGVVPEAQKSLEQVRRSLEALEKISPQIETTLREVGDLAKAGREFIPELKRTNDGLKDLFTGGEVGPALGKIVPELQKTNEDIRFFLKTATFWVEETGVMVKTHEPRIVKAIDSLTATSDSVRQIFSAENQKNIAETLKSVRDASARLDPLAKSAEELMRDGKATMKTLNSTMTQAELAINDVRAVTKPFAERAPKILQNIETGSDEFSKTMIDVRDVVRAIGRAEGSFQKIITDPGLYNNINDSVAAVTKLMPRLERILADVEVFSDKIARHPEALGIGGALRPSSGLKEAPTPRGP